MSTVKSVSLCVALLILLATVWAGSCGTGSTPTITLTATDCPVDDIVVTCTPSVRGESGRWIIEASVNVKCSGNPISGAEIGFDYPFFPGIDFKRTTDAQGNVDGRTTSQQRERPTGTVDVIIQGSDGQKTEPFTY